MHIELKEINIFRRKAESLLNTISKKYRPLNTVYHYTNCEAAVKILQSKTLLMTHPQNKNDTQELLYGEELIRKTVENLPFILSREIWHSLIEKSSYLDIYTPYIGSFCQDEDDLLAWNMYGDNFKGIAIGFNIKYFKNCGAKSNLHQTVGQGIIYDEIEVKNYVYKLFAYAEKNIKNIFKIKTHKDNRKYRNEVGIHIISNILALVPFIKSPNFKKENEYRVAEFVPSERLLSISPKSIYQIPGDRLLIIKNKYTNKEELAVKKQFNTTHIASITFGSHINQKNVDKMSHFLSIHYPNISINYSKLNLRHTED